MLAEILDHQAAPIALGCYYRLWAGRRFESLGRSDIAEDDEAVITPADVVAVSLLGVSIGPRVTLDLLDGGLGEELTALLRGIPTNVELGTHGASAHVGPDSNAQMAWDLLKRHAGGAQGDGQAWVIAGKLLARKRPLLIPVYDRVVKCVLQRPAGENYWLWLDDQLREQGLRERAVDLRRQADLPLTTPLLRVIDVVLWMLHQADHSRYPAVCAGFDLRNVPPQPACAYWRR